MASNGAASCLFSRDVVDDAEGQNLCREDGSTLILPELTEDNGQLVHVLLPFSSAIDQIPAAECSMDDQRGVERPQGELCDIGAYEFNASLLSIADDPIILTTVTPQPGPTPFLPTLNTDALCWQGPGPLYNIVSSVLTGVTVELLGRGIDGGWWIIDNPRYPGVPCWLPETSLDLDPDLDLSTLKLFSIPPLPTLKPTSITGCLYQGPNDNRLPVIRSINALLLTINPGSLYTLRRTSTGDHPLSRKSYSQELTLLLEPLEAPHSHCLCEEDRNTIRRGNLLTS